MSPDALTGLEANLRFASKENMATRIFGRLAAWQNWIFDRPNAVGEKGALKVYGTGEKGRLRPEPRLNPQSFGTTQGTTMSTINYSEKIPNNVNLGEDRTLQRALERLAAQLHGLVGRRGPRGIDQPRGVLYLRTAVERRPAGLGAVGPREDARLPLGHFPEPGRRQPRDPLRRPQGREGLAGRARRAPRQPAPHHRDAGRHRARIGRAAAPPGPRHRAEHV